MGGGCLCLLRLGGGPVRSLLEATLSKHVWHTAGEEEPAPESWREDGREAGGAASPLHLAAWRLAQGEEASRVAMGTLPDWWGLGVKDRRWHPESSPPRALPPSAWDPFQSRSEGLPGPPGRAGGGPGWLHSRRNLATACWAHGLRQPPTGHRAAHTRPTFTRSPGAGAAPQGQIGRPRPREVPAVRSGPQVGQEGQAWTQWMEGLTRAALPVGESRRQQRGLGVGGGTWPRRPPTWVLGSWSPSPPHFTAGHGGTRPSLCLCGGWLHYPQ